MKRLAKKVIVLLAAAKILSLPRKLLGKVVVYAISSRNGIIIYYPGPIINLIKQVRAEANILLKDNEGYQIFMTVKKTAKVKGDIAEVGVYKGGSAKIICEAKGGKTLHLFDTFKGLPDLSEKDNSLQFHKGEFNASLEDVRNYLRAYPNVHFYKGLFPDTAKPLSDKQFSFVNLDVDLYESTVRCLEFFYPRMNRGGIIISHDYPTAPGVKKAIDDFFDEKTEPVIELSGSQCMIVKV